jgi:hypothetical protein
MNTSREAFDLWHPACRAEFKRLLPVYWKRAWWWALVFRDTRDRACTAVHVSEESK